MVYRQNSHGHYRAFKGKRSNQQLMGQYSFHDDQSILGHTLNIRTIMRGNASIRSSNYRAPQGTGQKANWSSFIGTSMEVCRKTCLSSTLYNKTKAATKIKVLAHIATDKFTVNFTWGHVSERSINWEPRSLLSSMLTGSIASALRGASMADNYNWWHQLIMTELWYRRRPKFQWFMRAHHFYHASN